MGKKVLDSVFFEDVSGDIIDKVIREEELLNDDKPALNLSVINEHFQKRLLYNNDSQLLLDKLGLSNREAIKIFKIGYSDGSINDIASIKQKKYLNELGIFDLKDSLTFPVLSNDSEITGIMCVDIDSNVNYIGSSKDIFNLCSTRVIDEPLLTDSISGLITFIEIGILGVVFIPDIDWFCNNNLKILHDNRVKTVVIAFENKINSDLLKDILILDNINVKQIYPVLSDSWKESIDNGIDKQSIETLISEAQVLPEVKATSGLLVNKEGSTYIFTINEIIYRLFDVKEMFVRDLKVNIKAEYGIDKFPDTLNLYSSRSRNTYSNTLSKVFNIEPKRIEKDLLLILDYLETQRDKNLETDSNKDKYEMTEEERNISIEFLKNTSIFDIIVNDMEILGYVGEDLNKILLYVAASTRILDDPISVMIISQSASGKSLLVDTLRDLLPDEDVIAVTSVSDQALNYVFDMLHKFLILGESVHNELIEHQIREILSNKELSRLVTVKDEKTGKLTSKTCITKAIVSMVLGGTRYDVNPENASRFFIVNADESVEQTERIHEAQKQKYSLERKYIKEDVIPAIITKHQNAQRLLQKVTVVNPFRNHLKFPAITMRSRRDFERFIDLIAGVSFVRQFQKEQKTDGRFKYIESDLNDYIIAYKIMTRNVLPATMTDIPVGAISLYESIRLMVSNIANKNNIKSTEINFIQRDIRDFTGLNGDTIRKYLKVLVTNEYIQIAGGKTRGTRFCYKLREDKAIESIDISMIPTPEQMEKYIKTTKS